jgi:hypothetical protein
MNGMPIARGVALGGAGLIGLMLGWSRAGELVTSADDHAVLAGLALYALGAAGLFALVAETLRLVWDWWAPPAESET